MGHYANKCPKKSAVTSAAQSVRFKPTYQKKPQHQVRSTATRIKIPQNNLPKELLDRKSKHMLIDVEVDGHPARAVIDQQTTGASLIVQHMLLYIAYQQLYWTRT